MEGFNTVIYAADVIGGQTENFTGVEVHGVIYTGEEVAGQQEVQISDEKYDFVSAYVRHKDGRLLAVGDFGAHAEAATYGRQLAATYGWTFECPLTA